MAPSAGRKRKVTPQSAAEWGVILPVYLGVFGLAAMFTAWLATLIATGQGQTEPALLVSFGGLLAVGQGTQALAALRSPPPDPDEARGGDDAT